jgi:gamma-glutamyltranspeptidase/glutathione hydrolase
MKLKLFTGITVLFILSSFQGCRTIKQPFNNYTITKSAEGKSGMVVTAHPLATQVGLDVLKKGGNAVDAAIAVQFALAVCYPTAGNIGGGGFLVYYGKDKDIATLDFREKAPAKAHKDMYLDSDGNPVTSLSLDGALAGGVPGSVEGMWVAYQRYSKLKNWKMLLQPAIDAAEFGLALTKREAEGLNGEAKEMDAINKGKTVFTEKEWKEGDILIQKELAETLKAVRDKGRDGFYKGEVATKIAQSIQSDGGIMTVEDLANYDAKWRQPIITSYRGHKVITMPPPSSGGIVLTQLLHAVEPYDVKSMGLHSTALTHLMAEAERRSYADRAGHMGDSDFYPVPVGPLTEKAYTEKRMKNFDPQKATPSTDVKEGLRESEQTTHFSIVDKDGNAVSVTTTLNGGYGSRYVVKGLGFILNNEMDDFSVKPGVPNLYGLVGAEANKIEPGKRMLSSMTPTIVLDKNEKPYIIVGTPGGSTIITSVFQTILNIIDHGMDAPSSVAAPRFHHQWLPDAIFAENDCLSETVRNELKNMGHKITARGKIGRVETIIVKDGRIQGGADPRGDDDAKGY